LPAAIEIDDAPVLAGCWLLVTGRPSSVATALQKKQIEMTRSGVWGLGTRGRKAERAPGRQRKGTDERGKKSPTWLPACRLRCGLRSSHSHSEMRRRCFRLGVTHEHDAHNRKGQGQWELTGDGLFTFALGPSQMMGCSAAHSNLVGFCILVIKK